MKPIIEVSNLSKVYRLGTLGAKSFSDDIRNIWRKMRGRKDPLDPKVLEQLKTESNSGRINPERKNEFWALRDINFQIQPGEVVGIIGHNGAGKSTLLKILSRITEPTTGEITLRGRVSSLLEVGTGFHPELTGRENTYLNGAINGMDRKEVDSKLNDIVEFADVVDFIDTPVKRYSSGMYVRLAFAVAAHLEPEILIVDEVLAVGDAAFQSRCLAKMKEVANKGQTILFVSHNMQSIRNLCQSCIVLKDGEIEGLGDTSTSINKYLSSSKKNSASGTVEFDDNVMRDGTGEVRIKSIEVRNSSKNISSKLKYKEPFTIDIRCEARSYFPHCNMFLYLTDTNDCCVAMSYSSDSYSNFNAQPGEVKFNVEISNVMLPGDYYIFPIITNHHRCIDQIPRALGIEVTYEPYGSSIPYPATRVRSQMPLIESKWTIQQVN